jgi:RNA polymerase sigma-70 factor (ECF subfamily)
MAQLSQIGGSSHEVSAWIAVARGGSAQALGRLLEACRPYLLLVANQQLPQEIQGKVSPSDLVQETFLKAHDKFDRFHGYTEEELLAWLRRILLNNLASAGRFYQGADKRQVGREVALDADDSVEAFEQGVPSPDPSPSEDAVAREELDQLETAMRQLPELSRQVIHWRNWERLSFGEIGQRTGRSAEAARKLWARAVEQLQQIIKAADEP